MERCNSCGGVWHPATGHYESETMRWCGPCTRNFIAWLKTHLRRKWGKVLFYDHAATSIRPVHPERLDGPDTSNHGGAAVEAHGLRPGQ